MEFLHETAPFLVGLIVPPVVMFSIRPTWSGQLKFIAAFVPALVLGLCTSVFAGEVVGSLPDALIAIMIDASLVYTGSQLAYRLFWKPILAGRLQRGVVSEIERV
jgi:hypothetical protein